MADLTKYRSGYPRAWGDKYQVEAAITHEEELMKQRQAKNGHEFVVVHGDPDEHELAYNAEDGWTCLDCRVTVGKNAIVDEKFIDVKIECLLDLWSDLEFIYIANGTEGEIVAAAIEKTCRSSKPKNYSGEYIMELAREFTPPVG